MLPWRQYVLYVWLSPTHSVALQYHMYKSGHIDGRVWSPVEWTAFSMRLRILLHVGESSYPFALFAAFHDSRQTVELVGCFLREWGAMMGASS